MRKLHVFDFDDTLAKTSNIIRVRKKDGFIKELDSQEYLHYKREDGDILDFSDFRTPRDAEKIEEIVDILLHVVKRHGINSTVILTARTTDTPVKHFLKQHDLPNVQIMPVGREHMLSHPDDKAIWILWVIDKFEIDEIEFYDDHIANIEAVERICNSKAKIVTHLIKTKSPI
jgi:hypothetical protein